MPAKRKRAAPDATQRAASVTRHIRPHAAGARTPAALPVRLITPTGDITIQWPAAGSSDLGRLQRDAIEWTHLVRNRARWIGAALSAEQQDRHASDFLQSLGITDPQLVQIAAAGSVRVSIPWYVEERGWEARIVPWEYIISAATRDLRTGPLVVTRWLLRQRRLRSPMFRKVLFVESAPGRLATEWDFGQERRLVQQYAKPTKFEVLASPTMDELREKVRQFRPDIVHLAGFDNHQGLELLEESRNDPVGDGYLMAGRRGVNPVSASELAHALGSMSTPPSLVTCNIWNSAARIAPLLVAAGVNSVVGIQDQIDDALAEIFLGNFYRHLSKSGSLEQAFHEAWTALQTQPKPLRGTGIVLWHGGALPESRAAVAAPAKTGRTQFEQNLSPEAVDANRARQFVEVTVKPEQQFSYGLLHNDRDLFREFLIRNLSDARITGVNVFIELHSNEGTYPFRQSFTLDGPVLDLSRQVRIALTSTLARTLDEVLRTSLYVRVSWGPHEVFSQTFPVTLAPVDQWADTDTDRIFLPSFVFPRDRTVRTVIRNAEQFMTALRDDPGAGFDGYQSLDPTLPDPAAGVDHQVQALWYSIVYRVPASYINPPPTYAVASQRIRTPSEIVAGGFGTCIDLALMMASCLEAIEVYPVLFVLEDHAFPGYWRTDVARTAFRTTVAAAPSETETAATAMRGEGPSARRRPGAPWCFDKASLAHIRRAIDRHELVPLESVGLTARMSLGSAIMEARSYFEKSEESRFLLMLDVMTARESRVTPLPLGERLGERPNDRHP